MAEEEDNSSLDLFLKIKNEKKDVTAEERISEEKRDILAKNLLKVEDKDTVTVNILDPRLRSKRSIYANILANQPELVKAQPSPMEVSIQQATPPNPEVPYRIPKIPRPAVEVLKLDEWGNPLMPKSESLGSASKPKLDEWGQEEPVMSYGQHKYMTGVGSAPSFQQDQGQQRHVKPQPNQEVDEWGDPIKLSALKIITPPVTAPAAAKQELDEWVEPVKTGNNPHSEIVTSSSITSIAIPAQELDEWGEPIKPPSGNKVKEVSSAPEVDEWGDPIKPANTGAKSCSTTTVLPAAAQEVDEWGDPIKPTGAQQVPATDDWGSTSTTTPAADDWGGGSSSAASDDWGSNGSSSRSSFDGNSRGRGRGRGDRGGRGRGGSGGGRGGREAREPREGDWNCKECNAYNYSGRRECFRCQVAKPGGDNDDSFSNGGRPRGGGSVARRGRRNGGDNPNYEPVAKKVRTDFDERGLTPAQKKADLDDWGSTASVCGIVAPVDDNWGNSNMTTTPSDDWGRRPAAINRGNLKEKPSPSSTAMDDWGSAATENRMTPSTSPLVSRIGGGQKRNFNPATDWTDAGNGSQSIPDNKCKTEWICPDTRCGNLNFEWRQDCFRCGAEKTNSVVIQHSNRSTPSLRSPPELVSRQPRESPRLLSLYPPLDRIKAPPDEKNLKRTLSIRSSLVYERETGISVSTETPAAWSYSGKGLNTLIVAHDQSLLPLTHRFEAIAQNPGGGPVSGTSTALMKPSPAVVKSPSALQATRTITQIPEMSITAPRTRDRINAKWMSLQITVTDLPDKKTEAEKNEPKSEEKVEPKSEDESKEKIQPKSAEKSEEINENQITSQEKSEETNDNQIKLEEKSEEINENQMESEESAPSKDEQNLVMSTEPVIAAQELTSEDAV